MTIEEEPLFYRPSGQEACCSEQKKVRRLIDLGAFTQQVRRGHYQVTLGSKNGRHRRRAVASSNGRHVDVLLLTTN
jgi:hypothetical protein